MTDLETDVQSAAERQYALLINGRFRIPVSELCQVKDDSSRHRAGPLDIFWIGHNALRNLSKEAILWSPALVFKKIPTLDSGLKDVELESCVQGLLTKKPPSYHGSIHEAPMLTVLPNQGDAQTSPISPLRAKALV